MSAQDITVCKLNSIFLSMNHKDSDFQHRKQRNKNENCEIFVILCFEF